MLRMLTCQRNVFNYRESFILDSSAIIHSNILIRCWDPCTFCALLWIKLRLTNFECAIINFCTFVTMIILAFFIGFIDWMHYAGHPNTTRTSLLAMEKSWFEVRVSRRAYIVVFKKCLFKNTFADLTYALLYPSSRLRRLLRAPLVQKERFFYVCIRIKALSLIF